MLLPSYNGCVAQPQQLVGINRGNPLSRGLRLAWVAGQPFDQAFGTPAEAMGNVVLGVGPLGNCLQGNSSGWYRWTNRQPIMSGDFTVLQVATVNGAAYSGVGAWSDGVQYATAVSGGWYTDGVDLHGGVGGGFDRVTGPAPLPGGFVVLGIVCQAGVTNGTKYWQNSSSVIAGTFTPPTLPAACDPGVGVDYREQSAISPGNTLVLSYYWARALTDTEWLQAQAAVWKLLRKNALILTGGAVVDPILSNLVATSITSSGATPQVDYAA